MAALWPVSVSVPASTRGAERGMGRRARGGSWGGELVGKMDRGGQDRRGRGGLGVGCEPAAEPGGSWGLARVDQRPTTGSPQSHSSPSMASGERLVVLELQIWGRLRGTFADASASNVAHGRRPSSQ